MKKTGLFYEGVEIDRELQELMKVMNQLDWIETTSCCFGHPEAEYHKSFFIQLFCDTSRITTLAEILEVAQDRMHQTEMKLFLKCEFNYNSEVLGSQFEAPENSISLYLYLENFVLQNDKKGEKHEDKLDIVNWLVEGFKKS